MKELLSILISASLIYTSCDQVKKSTPTQRPVASPAANKDKLKDNENQMIAEQQKQSNAPITNAHVNQAIDTMMLQGNMFIKDYAGNDVSSETYKLNPSQYFLLFKNSNGEGYTALNSNIAEGSFNGLSNVNEDFHVAYKLYNVEGDMADFTGSRLGEPIVTDHVDLTATASASLNNKHAVNDLINRLQNSDELAYNAGFGLENSLFATAHADTTQKDKYLITAIVFTSVALVSYLFTWWAFGNMSLVVGIVFWFLYWFYEE